MSGDEWEQWMETSAKLIGLEIPENCRAGVLENLQRNFAIAETLMQFPLTDEMDAAPVFSA